MRGTYTLLLVCRNSFRIGLGRLGCVGVGEGQYLYTGSALGRGAVSLEGRLKRHWKVSKKTRWHVDYLTSHRKCRVRAAVCLMSRKRLECAINRAIVEGLEVTPVLPHAGSSDCACAGHLLKVLSSLSEKKVLNDVIMVYEGFGQPIQISEDVILRSRGLLPIFSRKHRERF